jgi:nitroimidazol reductase NimA-like FMN-containing flavoprotein (pyridoxamine 5'-phosphate oxidase superfamily)
MGVDWSFADLLDISTMTLATADLDGNPYVTPVYFVHDEEILYVFTPSWVRLVDNSKGFGFKEEWNLL